MAREITPEQLAKRMKTFQQVLSTSGMSAAAAAGLRPTRRQARKRNFGFKDRTGQARRKLGKVRRYKRRTVRKYRAGGAYFRGGSKVGAFLEYLNNGKYSWLRKAQRQTTNAQFRNFSTQARKELRKAIVRAKRRIG